MLRRSFLGALGSMLLVPTVFAKSNNDKWRDDGPYDFIWDDTKKAWIVVDPFVKIYTKDGRLTRYGKHYFYQEENHVTHYIPRKISENTSIANWSTYIPLDTKNRQKDKIAFLNELNKYRWKYEIFEIIADNGKSNLYAICDNERFQANLINNGRSQCSMLKF